MKIEWTYGDSILNLPSSCVASLPRASASALRVLLALAADKNGETLAARTGLDAEEIRAALLFWQKEGVLRVEGALVTPDPPNDEEIAYTGADIERICKETNAGELIDICVAILDKTFTPRETENLIYLYDHLGLGFDYVVRLCQFCHDIGKPSLRYVLKVGISLYDSGVTTVGALEAYIQKEKRKGDMEYRVRRLYGIGERALTPKENEYLFTWVNDWAFSYEMIELAYNKMMESIAAPKFSYENGILKKWHDAGYRTPEEVVAGEQNRPEPKKNGKKKEKEIGFDLDEFFNAATMRGADSETGKTGRDGDGILRGEFQTHRGGLPR